MNRTFELHNSYTIKFDENLKRRIIRMQFLSPVYESIIKVTCNKLYDMSEEMPIVNTLHCFSGNRSENYTIVNSDDINMLYITSDVVVPLETSKEYTFSVLDKDDNRLMLEIPIICTLTFEEE